MSTPPESQAGHGQGHPGAATGPAPAAYLLLPPQDPATSKDAGHGGRIAAEAAGGSPEAVIIAVGSEVQIALDARRILQRDGIPTRVVTMPSQEWFGEQSQEYRDEVLPPEVRARVSVRAGSVLGWPALVGAAGHATAPEPLGAGAPHLALYEQYGLTAERVAAAARASVARARGRA
ncbi:transketolase C-terminal domain-containing protein [Streptomyces sp. NPDC012888]|uniref:transketolase-like TK C-terminal-containing protein n=1 Tax=Streptomyces sp. NPDC012888 TaxID=3364855 RepID=UPI003690AC54